MKKKVFIIGLCGLAAVIVSLWLFNQPEQHKDLPYIQTDADEIPDFSQQDSNSRFEMPEDWFQKDFIREKIFLDQVRNALITGQPVQKIPELDIELNEPFAWVCITLFQRGNDPLRWISKRQTPEETVNRIIEKIRENRRFASFDVNDPERCRIMLEVITAERPVDIEKIQTARFDENRFEPGITGFKLIYNDRVYIYMPTDAVVNSHLYLSHCVNFISKKTGVAEETNKISQRIEILKSEPIKWSVIEGVSFVTFGNQVIGLYRGYPMPVDFSGENLLEMTQRSGDWVLDNLQQDGRFLYYYDAAGDTVIDHMHPTRSEEDNYYNILRHNGGIILLLKMYELTGRDKFLAAAEKPIDYLIKQLRQHSFEGEKAYYVYYNEKAKLGGSGTALVALMNYRKITGNSKYDEYIYGLVQHILSRITEDGEMIGYYIHPSYNDGKPILSPTKKERRELFSFYYPGEALLGLALFEHYMTDMSADYRLQVRKAAEKALDFLVKDRPVKYAEFFEPLPSDSWLMQAIEQWSYNPEFQKADYLNFVFNDANQMISHTYTPEDSPYYDYPGTFYYDYGDHAYPDGARAEGLIAAYYLAQRLGRNELAQFYFDSCKKTANALIPLYNSEQSSYMYKHPEKAIGAFRFKFTRHWVRIDTVQHVTLFYMRLLQAMEKRK